MNAATAWQAERRRTPERLESLSGYVARVAAAEGVPNLLEITSLGGIAWSRRPELSRGDADLAPVAEYFRVDEDTLAVMTYSLDPNRPGRRLYHGVSVDRRFIVHGERRFSPATLARRRVHLSTWQLSPFPFCEESGELLACRCPDPDCEARQSWYHAAGVELCDRCGESLVGAAHGAVSPSDLDDLRCAIGVVHPDVERRATSLAALPSGLRGRTPGDLLDLLVAVACVVDPELSCQSDRRTFKATADARGITSAMAEAWRCLTAWPASFQDLASSRIATRTGRFGDGNRGATMRFLNLPGKATTPAPLTALIDDVRQRFQENASSMGIGSKKASSMRRLTATGLTRLRREGRLSTIFGLDERGPQPLLDRKEVEALSDALTSSVTVDAAAAALGMTQDGVAQLAAIGLLEPEDFPNTSDQTGLPRIRTVSMEHLSNLLIERASRPDRDWLPLCTVMRRVGGRLKPWGSALLAIAEGRITYGFSETGRTIVDRLRVDARGSASIPLLSAVEFQQMIPLADLSKEDARVVLNLHARHGKEALRDWATTHGASRTVPMQDLLRMASDLISLGEVCARLDRCAKDASAVLATHGISRDGPWYVRREVESALF